MKQFIYQLYTKDLLEPKMAMSDSKATIRTVKRVQFGILSPDEIVSIQIQEIEPIAILSFCYI